MKVLTISDPLTGNKGSSSMILSIIENLSEMYPCVTFSVFTYRPREDRRIIMASHLSRRVRVHSATFGNLLFHLVPGALLYYILKRIGLTVPAWLWGEELNTMLSADIYIGAGGGIFHDSLSFKSFYHALVLLPAKLLGLNLIVYTQSLGPFHKRFNRFCAQLVLPYAQAVVGRGKITCQNLKEICLKNIDYAADGAFALKSRNDIDEAIRNKYAPLFHAKKVVGIAPNSELIPCCRRVGLNYAASFGELINYLTKKGFYPVLIPHSFQSRNFWGYINEFAHYHCNDLPVINEILRYVEKPGQVLVINEDYSYLQLRALIGLTDYFITSRFHGMVSALYMKRPILVCGWYDHKYLEVMDEFGLKDFCFDYEQLTGPKLIDGLNALVGRRQEILEKQEKNLPRIISEARHVYEIIKCAAENVRYEGKIKVFS